MLYTHRTYTCMIQNKCMIIICIRAARKRVESFFTFFFFFKISRENGMRFSPSYLYNIENRFGVFHREVCGLYGRIHLYRSGVRGIRRIV